jgi:hypothetical protein
VPEPRIDMVEIASSTELLVVTLVTGSPTASRESALVEVLAASRNQPARIALILEGLPDGSQQTAMLLDPALNPAILQAARIAPGCFCCIGNMTMRVTLNRILRQRPSRLYISLATVSHLDKIRALMTQAPYDSWLTLTDDMRV